MGIMRNIIDGNEAAEAYCRYMRPARRDGDRMPQRTITDPERTGYARELNSYLDRLVFGYEAVAPKLDAQKCVRCHKPFTDACKLKQSIYTSQGRIDFYVCATC